MSTSFYKKNRKEEGQAGDSSFLLRRRGGLPPTREEYKSEIVPPVPEDQTSTGAVGNGVGTPPVETVQTPQFSNQPSTVDAVGEMLKNGSLMNSPLYQQIIQNLEQNQRKRIALQQMPTYTKTKNGQPVLDKDGNPIQIQGMRDEDGRWKSGLQALVQRLSHMRPVRTWEELAGEVAGGVSAGVTGAIVPEWNEWQDRNREIQRLEQENEGMLKEAKAVSSLQTQAVGRQNTIDDNARQAEQLRQKKRTDFYRRNRAFDPTKATEAQVRELTEIGETPMSIGHYDFTKADLKWINGQAWTKDPITGAFMQPGLPIKENETLVEYRIKDPDTEVETTYMVPQQKAASLKTSLVQAGMQITAANERQQAGFTQSEKMQDDRQQFAMRMKAVTDENAAIKEVADRMAQGQKLVANREITQAKYQQGLVDLINMFNEPIRTKLMQKFLQGAPQPK